MPTKPSPRPMLNLLAAAVTTGGGKPVHEAPEPSVHETPGGGTPVPVGKGGCGHPSPVPLVHEAAGGGGSCVGTPVVVAPGGVPLQSPPIAQD